MQSQCKDYDTIDFKSEGQNMGKRDTLSKNIGSSTKLAAEVATKSRPPNDWISILIPNHLNQ